MTKPMKNLLEQLENNEAVLLMYLAGELPTEDRAEVEQMLGRDAGLRATLDELRGLHADVTSALGRLDAADPLPSRDSAVRQVSRAMTQAMVARAAQRPAAGPAGKTLRIGWLVYPAAAAAVILIATMIYMNQPGAPLPGTPGPNDIALIEPPAIFPEETAPESAARPQLAALEEEAISLSSAARSDDDALGLRYPDR
ncbi:MAG: hypothetical protein ACAI43_25175 [Phycisphaerae bacterium]|nr:hypothetical protein [Tepidisphaeraceae bacterium]